MTLFHRYIGKLNDSNTGTFQVVIFKSRDFALVKLYSQILNAIFQYSTLTGMTLVSVSVSYDFWRNFKLILSKVLSSIEAVKHFYACILVSSSNSYDLSGSKMSMVPRSESL